MAVEVGVEAAVQMEDVVVKEARAAKTERTASKAEAVTEAVERPQPSGGPCSEMRRLST